MDKYILPLLKENHPKPGQPYTGTTMTTSLPSRVKGYQVCMLLKVAFQRKLLFTIRGSVWSREYKVVPCEDVSHYTEIRYVLMVDRLI